jgi:hypothetical protein
MQCAVLEEETLRAYFAFLHETTHPDGDRSHRLCDHNFALPHENPLSAAGMLGTLMRRWQQVLYCFSYMSKSLHSDA